MTQLIVKDIGIEDEPSFGASVAGTARRIHVRTVGLGLNVNKAVVEQTGGTAKGRDVMTRISNTLDGDITAYASPKVLHELLELGMGTTATSTSVGTSASIYTYNQNTQPNPLTKTVNIDRAVTQEKFQGVFGTGFQISGSDNLLELTVPTSARFRAAGVSMADAAGEQTKPLSFSDVIVTLYRGATVGVGTTVLVSNWTLNYANGYNGKHMSGSRDYNQIDSSIPTISGSFQVYHEGASFADAAYGCSEFWLRIDAVLPTCNGLVAGVTPHVLRLDVPRIELTTSTRSYEQASMAMEDVEWVGVVNPDTLYLFRATLTSENGL